MSKKEKDWKIFEKAVHRIQQLMVPKSKVEYNVKKKGKAGTKRQLDACITKKIGQIEVFIVIEAKYLSRKINIVDVEGFSKKLEDVSANKGVIISSAGYTKSAIVKAKREGVDLCHIFGVKELKMHFVGKIPAILITHEVKKVRIGIKGNRNISSGDFKKLMNESVTRFENLWVVNKLPRTKGEIHYNEKIRKGINREFIYQVKKKIFFYEIPIDEKETLGIADVTKGKLFFKKLATRPMDITKMITKGKEIKSLKHSPVKPVLMLKINIHKPIK